MYTYVNMWTTYLWDCMFVYIKRAFLPHFNTIHRTRYSSARLLLTNTAASSESQTKLLLKPRTRFRLNLFAKRNLFPYTNMTRGCKAQQTMDAGLSGIFLCIARTPNVYRSCDVRVHISRRGGAILPVLLRRQMLFIFIYF